jgi:uroporphyrinogen-III synthase
VQVLAQAGLTLPPEVACVSIGPVTSAALREAGLLVAAEAREATLGALAEGCESFLLARDALRGSGISLREP